MKFKYLILLSLFFCLNNPVFSQKDLSKINIKTYYDSLRSAWVGNELPDITFTDSTGLSFNLKSLKGHPVAINLWTFTCKPCVDEIPQLNKLVDRYKLSVKFIALHGDGTEFNSQTQQFIKKFNFKYTPLKTSRRVTDYYGLLMAYPTHLLISKEGKVLDLLLGPQIQRVEETIKTDLK